MRAYSAVLAVLALSAVAMGDFLVTAWDGGAGKALRFADSGGSSTQEIWSGGLSPTITYDIPAGYIYLNFNNYGIYRYDSDGSNQTKVLDNTGGGFMCIHGSSMFVNPWPDGLIESFNMSDLDGTNLGASPSLQWTQFTPAPPNPGWKSRQMMIGPPSVGNDLLLAEFYGARVIHWDGTTVNGGYTTLVTIPGGEYCTGVAYDYATDTMFYSRDDHDAASPDTNNVVYSVPFNNGTPGTPVVFHDYSGTGSQPQFLLVQDGRLYVLRTNSDVIDAFNISDGSVATGYELTLPTGFVPQDIVTTVPIPEPVTLALLGVGAVPLAVARRRRRK